MSLKGKWAHPNAKDGKVNSTHKGLLNILFTDQSYVAGLQQKQAPSPSTTTRSIIVRNLPASADEELLELFFESTKKQGGGPVESVKIFGDKQGKQVACVEFCNSNAVETVLRKRPVKLGKTELDVQPFEPLLQGSEKIREVRVNLTELFDNFTDDLLQKQAKGHAAVFEMLQICPRATRRRDRK